MRLAFTLACAGLGLILSAWQPAASQSGDSSANDPTPVSAAGNPSDAAEKHAKRTACLKDAKAKKLVGAQKTAFLKDCMASDASKPLDSTSPRANGS